MNQQRRLEALTVELQAAHQLAQSLESQREALIAKDTDRLAEITASLRDQFALFRSAVAEREANFGAAPTPSGKELALLAQLRAADYRVKALAELNHEILADRLAYLRLMLEQICPRTPGTGYYPTARAGEAGSGVPPAQVARSA